MNQVYYRLWAVRKIGALYHKAGTVIQSPLAFQWNLYCSDDGSQHTESTHVARFQTLDHLMQYARAEWPDIDVQVQPNKEEDDE